MRLPDRPSVKALKHLSPSLYSAALTCKARAAWIAFGDRSAVPQHPKAILGICVHAVAEAAHKGQLPSGDDESRRAAARGMFDRTAGELYDRANPLLRAKFSAPDRLPYYNLFRERAALLALEASASLDGKLQAAPPPGAASPAQAHRLVEAGLESPDGLLIGRADYIDTAAGEVVDYKTGTGPEEEPGGITESEARQLRFYVHLARAVGLNLSRGVVVRADGRRAAMDVSEPEAAAEGHRAREVLHSFNAEAGRSFEELAEPGPDTCRNCPCIPLCEPFWRAASATWAEQCGTHVEGTVSGVSRSVVQNIALLTLDLTVERGTAALGRGVVQQLPETWATADGTAPPGPGDLVRLVTCRVADAAADLSLIRADRLATALWTVRSDTQNEKLGA